MSMFSVSCRYSFPSLFYAESDVQQALVGELFAFVAQNAKSRPFVRQKLKEVIGYIRHWYLS